MDEKNSIKVRLSTVIFMFIIFVLLLVIFGMWYYYNNIVGNVNNTSTIIPESNIAINNSSTNISSNNNLTENSTRFTLGNYIIQFDEDLLGEEFKLAGNEIKGHDYEISFLENNKITVNIGFGNYISGSYTISNNIITCNIDTHEGEYGPAQKINATISFEIDSPYEIEIINASESYEIKVVDIVNNSLTDETKDMSLWPLVKGIKYVLSE